MLTDVLKVSKQTVLYCVYNKV